MYSYKSCFNFKKAFTLNVQISKEQQLITNGMYKFVRHPAYTGSILSLLGVSIALKNIPAILIVAICSFVCYQIRINVEEAVLQKYFKEYNLYKEKTYKLFPYIY
ncbi:methyltransferase family protein [Gallintestinimicrobium sp.]|uniref:methyltransferase family protein n=1 Tax=Gallintestinimicrobium sp. TaxID=2981655 RepID=UPI00399A7F77